MKKVNIVFLILLLAGISTTTNAQGYLTLFGSLKDYTSEKRLKDCQIEVYNLENNSLVQGIKVKKNGKFNFNVPFDRKLMIKFSCDGYVTKKIEFNTEGVPAEEKRGGYAMNLNLKLLRMVAVVDYSALEGTHGRTYYNAENLQFDWDFELTKAQREIEKAIIEDTEKRLHVE